MSDTSVPSSSNVTPPSARPVSLVTIVFLFVVFAAFFFFARHYYRPSTVAPQVAAAENLPQDLAWKATRDSRRATLNELRDEQNKQLDGYRWIDQQAGVVHLPITRAMELTVQHYAPKK